MKRMDATQLLALHERSKTELQTVHELYDELARYILPSRLGFREKREPGDERTRAIYDSTAPQALEDLANYLAAGITPAASPWLMLQFREDGHNEVNHWNEWLDECTKRLRAELARSNFYEVTNELYADIPCFGMGCSEVVERRDSSGEWEGLHFEAPWLKEISYIPDQYGELTTTFRRYSLSAIQWWDKFEQKAGPSVAGLVAEGKPDEKVEFLHVVYPRDEKDIDRKALADPNRSPDSIDSKKLPFASVWINCKDKLIVREAGAFELPRGVVRWGTTAGTIHGYGPGHISLPDVRTVNEAKRLELLAWERNIDRPMKSMEGNIIGNLDLSAGGHTQMRDVRGTEPLFEATDFQLSSIKVEELQRSILRTFFSDLIREPGQENASGTAYEAAKRVERAQRILGEAVGHVRRHLRWMVERSFQLMYRAGQFPPAPDDLLEAGAQLDVRYTSPLQSSQEAQGLEQITLFLGDMAQLAEFNPEVMDWVDWDGLVREVAKRRSLPAKAMHSEEEVEEVREARRELMEQQAEAEQMQQGADVVQKVGRGAGQGAAMRLVNGGA